MTGIAHSPVLSVPGVPTCRTKPLIQHLHPRQIAVQQNGQKRGGTPPTSRPLGVKPYLGQLPQTLPGQDQMAVLEPVFDSRVDGFVEQHGETNQFGHAADVQLFHQAAAMFFNRLNTEAEFSCHHLIRVTGHHQTHDIVLARG